MECSACAPAWACLATALYRRRHRRHHQRCRGASAARQTCPGTAASHLHLHWTAHVSWEHVCTKGNDRKARARSHALNMQGSSAQHPSCLLHTAAAPHRGWTVWQTAATAGSHGHRRSQSRRHLRGSRVHRRRARELKKGEERTLESWHGLWPGTAPNPCHTALLARLPQAHSIGH